MKGGDLNSQFEALKRQAVDLVHELHARKLAIPAGALLLAIVAAVVLLPKSSTPPPAPPTAATPTVEAPRVARVAQVSLVEPTPIGDDVALSNTTDPFVGSTGYSCKLYSSSPKTYECIVSDLKVRVVCTADGGGGPCAEKGSSGEAGGSSGAAGGDTGGSTPATGDGGGGGKTKKKTVTSTYYVISTSLDGTTSKAVESGDELPNSQNPLVIYAGTNDAHDKAVFIASDGVTVTGVKVDPTFGSFSLKKGQTATLVDANGAEHKLTLKSISKITSKVSK